MVLTPHQREVADRVLAHESSLRSHVVISLSGAHAYGFPSPDSDLDLKAVHMLPANELLGFPRVPAPAERLEVIDGVEIDYSSNELGGVLLGLIKGNGNYFERFLSRFALSTSRAFEVLKPVVQRALSSRVGRHYFGFATQQRNEWERTHRTSTKKLLYVLRTTVTGTHLLKTGELETDLSVLADRYELNDAHELIEAKKRGERSELPTSLAEKWAARVDGLFTMLLEAEKHSVLPSAPVNEAELESALIDLRSKRA
ncbi:MAG: DNA polymerase beta superfamily protein [Archangium sp.]